MVFKISENRLIDIIKEGIINVFGNNKSEHLDIESVFHLSQIPTEELKQQYVDYSFYEKVDGYKVLNKTATSAYFDSYEDFLSFLNNTDDTMEYYYVSKDKSNLSVDLYIDDCSSYKRHNHPLWMYFCNGYSHNDELVPISISNSPQIMISNYTTNLPSLEISRITQFIKDNQNIIQDIADEKINSIEFVDRINHRSLKLCVEKIDRNISEMAKNEMSRIFNLKDWQIVVRQGYNNVEIILLYADIFKNTKLIKSEMKRLGFFPGISSYQRRGVMLWKAIKFEPHNQEDLTKQHK